MRTTFWLFGCTISLVSACAAPIERSGSAPPAMPAAMSRTIELADPPPGQGGEVEAAYAVRDALLRRGYREAPDAAYRLAVGFAVAPMAVELDQVAARKGAQPSLALCRRRRYVLSAALIDRKSGEAVYRGRAAALRCGRALDKLLPRLAAALFGEDKR